MTRGSENAGRGPGRPDGPDDVVNRFGTYEVQATADTDNRYPMIAQGLSRMERVRAEKNPRLRKAREDQKERRPQPLR